MLLGVLDHLRGPVANRDLVRRDPVIEPARRALRLGLALQHVERRLSVEREHALQPGLHARGPLGHPLLREVGRRDLVGEDAVHEAVLEFDVELEVLEQPAEVRALLDVPFADQGIDRRGAIVGSERIVAAREVLHRVVRVHRVRRPAEKHDGRLHAHGALDLRQHALLARLDQFEAAQPEPVLLDQAQHHAVAVVAGFDAINRCSQLFSEFLDVAEVLEARLPQVVGHGQRVLGADEVGAQLGDGTVREVRLEHFPLRGQPVAEEGVDIAVLHRLQRYRHRQHGDVRLVAEFGEDLRRDGRGGRFRRPADVREADLAAGGRIGGLRRCVAGADQEAAQQQARDRGQRPQATAKKASGGPPARIHFRDPLIATRYGPLVTGTCQDVKRLQLARPGSHRIIARAAQRTGAKHT